MALDKMEKKRIVDELVKDVKEEKDIRDLKAPKELWDDDVSCEVCGLGTVNTKTHERNDLAGIALKHKKANPNWSESSSEPEYLFEYEEVRCSFPSLKKVIRGLEGGGISTSPFFFYISFIRNPINHLSQIYI